MNQKIERNKNLIIRFYNEKEKPKVDYSINNNDIILGNTSAPVIFIIYAGYLCPHCKQFFEETFPLIYKKYIKKGYVCGIIRFITKPENEMAFNATKYAKCIEDEDIFIEYNTLIYNINEDLTNDKIKKIMDQLKIDSTNCRNEEALIKQLEDIRETAFKSGIRGTPAFIINGELIKGNRRLKKFYDTIEKYL